jgi:hypothetical protein
VVSRFLRFCGQHAVPCVLDCDGLCGWYLGPNLLLPGDMPGTENMPNDATTVKENMHPNIPTNKPLKRKPVSDVEVDDEEIFDVESILAHRKRAHKYPEYLISWKGYGESDNTWEPKENISAEALQEYRETRMAKRRTVPTSWFGRALHPTDMSSEYTGKRLFLEPDHNKAYGVCCYDATIDHPCEHAKPHS